MSKVIKDTDIRQFIHYALNETVPNFIRISDYEKEEVVKILARGIIAKINEINLELQEESDSLENERKILEDKQNVLDDMIQKLKELKITMQV